MRTELVSPHGRILILDEAEPLLPEEQAAASTLGPVRRREWELGRTALRALAGTPAPILRDDRGRPLLPAGLVGSISHKGERAAAIVAAAGAGHVGIDLERAAAPRQDIGRRILTPDEQRRIADPREVTLHFAIKEAIYKAIDPMLRRYVGFTEVSLVIGPAGACTVDPRQLPLAIEAWWTEHDGYWVATARALQN